MGDTYWNRQSPMHQSGGFTKQHRFDNGDFPPSGVPMQHGGGHQPGKDTRTLGSAYDRYLLLPHGFARATGGGGRMQQGIGRSRMFPVDPVRRTRETFPLPPDASNTLYIEGLPPNSTKREVAHIFRPFEGYREVRLVRKESKHGSGDPLILCFVDFIDAASAATALPALQGYIMDEDCSDSSRLRLQFSKYPGPRSGAAFCRKR